MITTLLAVSASLASDGVQTLTLDDAVRQSEVIAVATLSDPVWTSQKVSIPLPTEPPRTMDWSEQVVTLTVDEVLFQRGGSSPHLEPGTSLSALRSGAHQHFARSVVYETEGRSRGIIHRRYEGSLDKEADLAGTQVLVFLNITRGTSSDPPAHDKAWTEAYGTHGRLIAMDALSARKKVAKLVAGR